MTTENENFVLCAQPDGEPVVLLSGCFALHYEEELLASINAYVHYIDEANERADAWVKVVFESEGIIVQTAEPIGDRVICRGHQSHAQSCWAFVCVAVPCFFFC